jgi:hypothetical protein
VIQNKSSQTTVFTVAAAAGAQAIVRRACACDATAMIITHRGDMSSLTGAYLFALKSIRQSSKAISW